MTDSAFDESQSVDCDSYDVVESGPYAPPVTYVLGPNVTTELVGVPIPSFGKAVVTCVVALLE